MAGSHAHTHGSPPNVPVARGAVRLLLGFLALCAVSTVVGLLLLWPDGERYDTLRGDTQYAAPGVSYLHADVQEVQPPCPDTRSVRPDCGQMTVELTEGPERGSTVEVQVSPNLAGAGLDEQSTVLLQRIPPQEGHEAIYALDGVVRHTPLAVMAVAFVIVVAAVARWRGILALVSLGLGGVVLFRFMLPALLTGGSGVAIALVGSAAIMFVVLYLSHGPTVRTSAALAGTLVGVGMTAGIGELAVKAATLSGVADDGAAQLTAYLPDLSFQGLLMCALVSWRASACSTTSRSPRPRRSGSSAPRPRPGKARAVPQRYAHRPRPHRLDDLHHRLRVRRQRAGRAVAAVALRPAAPGRADHEPIAEEIVRTLATGIGLVLAVPVTTAIAAMTVGPPLPLRRLAHEDEVHADQGRDQAQ